ncbi:hypothetical protein Sjap_019797 [Stephania japonica]|uniref:Uncharacterized protein n=1 Tax=Stephania japonica TaxID=461633 RepID=A0AAP0F4R4_9MAGN
MDFPATPLFDPFFYSIEFSETLIDSLMDVQTTLIYPDHGRQQGDDSISNTDSATTPVSSELDHPRVKALKHLSENYESIFESQSYQCFYSDAKIIIDESREVPIHRCVLAARSTFFANLFLSGNVSFKLSDLVKDFDVDFECLAAVLSYLYSGQAKSLPSGFCVCVDESCEHVSCRPVVDYLMKVLFVSFSFQISELLNLYQRYLLDILDKVSTNDIVAILNVANKCDKACEKLRNKCIEFIFKYDMDAITLEKTLMPDVMKEIMDLRRTRGLVVESFFPSKHVRCIHRALDTDDIELLKLLLQEGKTDIDDAYALHYAVAHCDARTVTKLLDLEVANVNHRNLRAHTVLHVAAMRREPEIIMALITKGARLSDLTLDGWKALQISKRLTRSVDYNRSTEQGRAPSKDKLCIGILEQAERREPLIGEAALCCAATGNEMIAKLLYLEIRVSVATILYPGEAKVARFTAQVDGTREFILTADLRNLINGSRTYTANVTIDQEHVMRMTALSRTVELAKIFFPYSYEVISKLMEDEDLSQLAWQVDDTPEQRLKKKQRYTEIHNRLVVAFNKDKVELQRSNAMSTSSSSSTGVRLTKHRRFTAN